MGRAPKLFARQYRMLAGEYRQMGDLSGAYEATKKACQLDVANLGNWMRLVYLGWSRVLHRLRGERTVRS